MADVISKVISNNNIRHLDAVSYVDKFGNIASRVTQTPNGVLPSDVMSDRATEKAKREERQTTLTLTLANTQYSWIAPEGTKKYSFKTRTTSHNLKFAFQPSVVTSTGYTSLSGGIGFESPTEFWVTENKTIYFASTDAGAIVEILYWI